ncbi:MAG: DNA-directed RNA polymerase subunit D [Candidatus Marsarchaeota archaeon]|jgi:DNA-directed RNA polymerase, alpha subunit/40 kD subunit|nr:DNA-directed RNA polymerase subunit D [Candidatus Marsarchaeota archaeon]
MKIEVKEEGQGMLRFSLEGTGTGPANALRRAAINSVSTFAIDKISFYENTSAMFDDYIAHRIGLVPLVTPSKGYGAEDEILFTLEAVGPKTVYSAELVSSDPAVKVANPNIPLIKLAEGQKIRAEGKAVLGKASRHSKFQPGIVSYDQEGESFNFYVESFGQMPPKEIINKACEVIKDELKEIGKAVGKL